MEVTVDSLKVPGVAFRKVGGHVLVSGEQGGYALLSPGDFQRYLSGGLVKDEQLWKDLQAKGLVKDHIDFQGAARKTLDRRLLVWHGPNVHRVETTGMAPETARATVDWIFRTPATSLTVELSGGAPLESWDVTRFVIEYARASAEKTGRTLALSIDVDPERLDGGKFKVLVEHKAGLRFFFTRAPFTASGWTAQAVAASSGEHEGFAPKPVAVFTVTREALGAERAVVEELVRQKFERVAFEFDETRASAAEYARFYREAFTWLVKAGLKDKPLKELNALRFLARILADRQWAYPEREAVDRVSYDAEGGITLFDEGPGRAEPLFRAGDVRQSSFNAVIDSAAARAGLTALQPDGQPLCAQCAYRPYCGGVGPAGAMREQGTLWGRTPDSARCQALMAVQDVMFERVQEWEARENLFAAWLKD